MSPVGDGQNREQFPLNQQNSPGIGNRCRGMFGKTKLPSEQDADDHVVSSVSSDSRANFLELLVRLGSDRSDSCQADDDDQGQHHSVLNCGGAIFFLQELNNAIGELFHRKTHIGWKFPQAKTPDVDCWADST